MVLDFHAVAAARERECRVRARAYSTWLSTLRPANVILVVGAAVLSTVAGSVVLGTKEAGNLPAYLALGAAICTIVHTALNCDVHQAECRMLRSVYEAQADRYRSLQTLEDPAELRTGIRELDIRQAALREKSEATPPGWAVRRAERREAAPVQLAEQREAAPAKSAE